ncbi:hypothetical protein M1146_03820 [Patescibacteria group bacterium]|nr:hypothetical protein [Patescibacteria group bacterium]
MGNLGRGDTLADLNILKLDFSPTRVPEPQPVPQPAPVPTPQPAPVPTPQPAPVPTPQPLVSCITFYLAFV